MLCDPTLICQIPVVFFYIINFFTWFLDFLFKPFVIINWRSACEVLIKLCAGIAIERLPKVWIIKKKSGNQEGHSVMDHQRCVFWWFFIPLMWPPHLPLFSLFPFNSSCCTHLISLKYLYTHYIDKENEWCTANFKKDLIFKKYVTIQNMIQMMYCKFF